MCIETEAEVQQGQTYRKLIKQVNLPGDRSTLLATAGYKTATLLFNKMHYCIFRAPMSFFDATPSGRIINRVRSCLINFIRESTLECLKSFVKTKTIPRSICLTNLLLFFKASTDQSAVDLSIPALIGSFAFSIIRVLGVIGVMSLVAWQVFIVFIPVIATCIWYQVILVLLATLYKLCPHYDIGTSKFWLNI